MTLPSKEAIEATEEFLGTAESGEAILREAYRIDVAPLLARVSELESFRAGNVNIGLKYCKEHRTITVPFVGENACCLAAERDRLKEANQSLRIDSERLMNTASRLEAERDRMKEEVLQIGEQMAKRHEENKHLEVELAEYGGRRCTNVCQRCHEQAHWCLLAQNHEGRHIHSCIINELAEARKAFKLLQERLKEEIGENP